MTISATNLAATLENLPERDLVALVAFRGLVQSGDPDAGLKAYELADDFLAARDGAVTPTDRPNYSSTSSTDSVNPNDDDLPF
jgi:hypothetical protein